MLNLPRFVFINGPAGSGKSTLANLLCETSPKVWREAFAEPIRDMLRAVFFPEDSPVEGPDRIDFRDGAIKKTNLGTLANLGTDPDVYRSTVRNAMIDFSEKFMKPQLGSDVFGRLLWKRCLAQEHWYSTFVIDDSGFVPEAQYVISQAGAESCLLIRLHRNGCDFSGDSRSYIDLPGVATIAIRNDGAAKEMLDELHLKLGNL